MHLPIIMNRTADLANLSHLPAGTVLRVNCGLYDHVALLGEPAWGGERSVLSFAPGGLTELGFNKFAAGRQVFVDGCLGGLAPIEVLAKAREVGQHLKYSWVNYNCEHFVRDAHGIAVESPQVNRAFFLGLAGFAFLGCARA